MGEIILKHFNDNSNENTDIVYKDNKTIKQITLYINNDNTKPITAAGLLLYKNVNNKMMLLIIDSDGKYEDIGGKIDSNDIDLYSTVAREVEEETNGQIKQQNIVDRLKFAQYIYVPQSKYLLFILEATQNECKLNKNDFGDHEINNGTVRDIGWLSREDLNIPATIKFRLNWRLRSKTLFTTLHDIENKFKYKQKLFKKCI